MGRIKQALTMKPDQYGKLNLLPGREGQMPTSEYGFITAISPEEIEALGIKGGQQHFERGEWRECHALLRDDCKLPRRVAIDPGEGWEIVPEDGALKLGDRAFRNGEWWPTHLVGQIAGERCAKYPSILAFRRPKTVQAGQGESDPASLPLNQRLFDLVRYCRAELHQQDLITDEEYTLLLAGPDGKCSVRNLESYDQIRSQLDALKAHVVVKDEAIKDLLHVAQFGVAKVSLAQACRAGHDALKLSPK